LLRENSFSIINYIMVTNKIRRKSKMKLTLKERLMVPRLFPQKGSLLIQMAIRDINTKIAINEKEAKAIGLKSDKGSITWEAKKSKEKEIDFTDLENNFLKDQVKRIDKEASVTPDILDLCLKIKNYEAKPEKTK